MAMNTQQELLLAETIHGFFEEYLDFFPYIN